MDEKDLSKLSYTPWLENALRELVNFPVKGICMFATTENGEIYSNYSDGISFMDKITIAGLIQQDATMETLIANGYVEEPDEDEKSF